MFDLLPFRRQRRGNQPEEREDPYDALVSDFFSDMLDTADIGFKTDIKEDRENYYIEAELPGLDKKDINLELKEDHLIISATNEETQEIEEENYIRKERRTGTYQRTFRIDNVKKDKITAEYDNGLLKVQLPKEDTARDTGRRVIDIE